MDEDFEEVKVMNLNKITVLKREFFEETQTQKLKKLQKKINASQQKDQSLLEEKLKHETVDVDIKVKSFAPKVFRFIRNLDDISEFDIMKSVNPKVNKM